MQGGDWRGHMQVLASVLGGLATVRSGGGAAGGRARGGLAHWGVAEEGACELDEGGGSPWSDAASPSDAHALGSPSNAGYSSASPRWPAAEGGAQLASAQLQQRSSLDDPASPYKERRAHGSSDALDILHGLEPKSSSAGDLLAPQRVVNFNPASPAPKRKALSEETSAARCVLTPLPAGPATPSKLSCLRAAGCSAQHALLSVALRLSPREAILRAQHRHQSIL